jgi:hypothetical protein
VLVVLEDVTAGPSRFVGRACGNEVEGFAGAVEAGDVVVAIQ